MAEPMSLTLGGVIYAGAILAGNQSVQEALTNTVLNLGTGICLEAITGRKSSRLEALNYWRKQCAKPDNHDIEKAVYRSHLMACRLLLEQQLEKDKHKSVWSAKTKPALEKLKVIFDKDIRTTKKKNWRIPSENDQPHLFATDTIHDSLSSHSDRNSKLNTSLVDIAITDVLRRFTPDLPEYSHEAERLLKAWLEIQFHDVNQGYIKAIGYFIADEIKHGDDAFIRIFMAAESIEMRKDLVHLTELVSNALTVTIDLKVLAHFEQIHHSILQQLKQLQADVGEISEGVGNANLGIEKILETIEPVNAQPNSLLLPLPLKRTARTYEPELMQKLMADLTSGEAHLARVCVRGVGGIGKSTLVETIFHRLYDQGAFNHYLFVYADKGVTATLVELAEQFKINVTHDDWQKKLAIKLATLGPSMLVAIDNLQNLQINDANPLLNLPGAIVVSSREKVPGLSTKDYKGLSETDCIALYRQHNEDESDIESIRLLVELTAHHTLAIELLAKQAAASILSASALYQTIKEKGFNLSEVYSEPVFAQQGEGEYINEQIFKHFEILFDLSQLKPEDKKSLGLIALLGAQPCTAQYFKTALSLADFTGLNTLAQLGWVQRSNLDQSIAFSVHPIIQGVVLENAFPATNDVNILLENIFLLANEAYNQGRYADAERELRAIWAIRRRPEALGEEHPDTLATRHNIAHQLGNQGRYADAEKELRAIWAIQRRPEVLGEEHPDTLTTRHNIAQQMGNQGRYADAEKEFRAILAIRRRPEALGEEHPDTLATRANIAYLVGNQGRYADAEKEFRAIWAILRRPEVLGEEHPDTLGCQFHIARLLTEQTKFKEAKEIIERIEVPIRKAYFPTHKYIIDLNVLISRIDKEEGENE